MKTSLVAALLLGGFGTAAWAFPAPPTVSDVTSTVVTVGGRDYHDVQATLNGAGPDPYHVPATFFYPVDPAECNGTGVVDLLNNSAMILLASTGHKQRPLPAARARLTDGFLASKGYVYASVQWEKTRSPNTDVIGLFNQLFGTNYAIPTNADQFFIIFDAALALRSPLAGLPGSPCAVGTVVAYGMSASTVPLDMLKQPALVGAPAAAAFAALYDGMIWDSITAGFLPFPIAKTGVPTIAVSSETDVQLFRNDVLVRGENPQYRSYEVAGVTHVSRDEHNLDDIVPNLTVPPSGTIRQDLASHSPVHRAMLEHLRLWVTVGTPPPPSVWLDGSGYSLTPLPCVGLPIPGIANLPRDSHGNALGGIRLPFLATAVCAGGKCKEIGSPLGHYNGIETQFGCSAGGFPQVAIVTGTFLRDDTLIDGYENHGEYVSGVSQAAQYAFEQGWILEEDIEGFTSLAGECVVGHASASDITLDDLKACHNTGP
jgi:hypothetical protein